MEAAPGFFFFLNVGGAGRTVGAYRALKIFRFCYILLKHCIHWLLTLPSSVRFKSKDLWPFLQTRLALISDVFFAPTQLLHIFLSIFYFTLLFFLLG